MQPGEAYRYDNTIDPIIHFLFHSATTTVAATCNKLLWFPVCCHALEHCHFPILFSSSISLSVHPLSTIPHTLPSTHPLHTSPSTSHPFTPPLASTPHPLHSSPPHLIPPHLLPLTQSHQRIQLVPLSNYSPNVSSDEYGLSDNEHPEHLYSLGKFVAVTPHRRGLIPSPSGGSPTPQRRGTQSATTTDPKWIPPSVQQDSRDACSSPDVKRKKDRNRHPVKTKRSKTFQASSSSQAEFQRNVSGLMEESEQAVMVTTSETSETSLQATHGSHDNYTELL